MIVATFALPINTARDATTYKANIDNLEGSANG
jgi:hypothetical protein